MSALQPKIIILFGRSGSGKGTQAKLLVKEFGFNYISSGDLLRNRTEKQDFTGQKLKEVLERGELVPTPIMFEIWAEEIERTRQEIDKHGLIIDGSPRSLIEVDLMDGIFEWYQWDNIKVILLDISEQEAFDRLTNRRRSDDKPEAIRARMAYFKKDVQPAVDHYKKQERLININGERSIEDIYYDIKKAIRN